MTKYNIIRNGSFQSLTGGGEGDISLSWAELETLIDGTLDSGGVSITNSGILYLEANLSQRIKVDGIRLYANDLTKSANIDFYYSNTVTGTYTHLATNVGSYYYTTIAEPSAPRRVLVTISGINIDLYEFQIFNDDFIVAFGQDGSQYAEYLNNTPIGEEGTSQAIALYNNGNSSISADAYTVVDYTGEDGDNYIKISSSQNGTYYGINDGVLVESEDLTDTYRWDLGTFDNTEVSADNVIVTPPSTSQEPATSFSEIPFANYSRPYCYYNTLLYNNDDDVVYFISRDGTLLKLWSYDYENNAWTYESELRPGPAIHQGNVTVAVYLNGYVYVISRVDVDTYVGAFFRYDVNGVQDNYEDLPLPPAFAGFSHNAGADRISMCTDGVKYIYIATLDQGNMNTTTGRNFARYDTTTSGWVSLSNGYDNQVYYQNGANANMFGVQTMTYDTDRNVIYMLSMVSNYYDRPIGDSPYLCRYHVGTDTWSNSFLRLDSGGINAVGDDGEYTNPGGICYHEDWIYFGPDPEVNNNSVTRYNINTAVTETIAIGYENYNGTGNTDYTNHEGYSTLVFRTDGTRYIMLTNINGHRDEIYRTPQVPAGPIEIIADGTYTTPVFKLSDKYNSSYFIVDGTTDSETGNISYDENVYNGTIRVRGSDTAPITIDEVYISQGDYYIMRWIPYTGSKTTNWKNPGHADASRYDARGVRVDRKTGDIIFSYYYDYLNTEYSYIYKYDRSGNLLYSMSSNQDYFTYAFTTAMSIDQDGGVWGYADYGGIQYDRHLVHFNSTLAVQEADVYESGLDFLYDMTAEWNGNGCWYTHQLDNILYHLDRWGTVLHTIPLDDVRAVASTRDNGCWVHDVGLKLLLRYDSDGDFVKSVNVDNFGSSSVVDMHHDYEDGVWLRVDYNIYHMTSEGVFDIGPIYIDYVSRLHPSHNGVYVVRTTNPDAAYFIDKDAGAITKSWTYGVNDTNSIFGVFSYNYDDYLEYGYSYLPISYDPVWGTGGSLVWTEVVKDGYFLSKNIYHQVEVTLRGEAVLEKVLMPPAIKKQDIPAGTYKNIYIKTDIPDGVDIDSYSGRIKTWWGVEE